MPVRSSYRSYAGPPLETTSQMAYRPYDNMPRSFLPETKHRNLKAQDHEFVEQVPFP